MIHQRLWFVKVSLSWFVRCLNLLSVTLFLEKFIMSLQNQSIFYHYKESVQFIFMHKKLPLMSFGKIFLCYLWWRYPHYKPHILVTHLIFITDINNQIFTLFFQSTTYDNQICSNNHWKSLYIFTLVGSFPFTTIYIWTALLVVLSILRLKK